MGHLVEDAAGAVVVVAGALRGKLGEAPEAVVGAGDDDVVVGDGVQQGGAVGAVAVGVRAGDLGGGGLDAGNVVVDGLDLGDDGGGLEPGGVVVGGGASSGGGGLGHGDGVADAGLQSGSLGSGARGVGDGALLDAGAGRAVAAGDVLPGDNGLVGSDRDLAGGDIVARGEALEVGRSLSASGVAEALDGGDLGLVDALELVALGGVDGDGDSLASIDLLESAGVKALALVVDVDALEGESVALCVKLVHVLHVTICQSSDWSVTYRHRSQGDPWWHGR